MKIRLTDTFKSDYAKLNDQEARHTKAKLDLLLENLYHPSLRVKKMKDQQGRWVFTVCELQDP